MESSSSSKAERDQNTTPQHHQIDQKKINEIIIKARRHTSLKQPSIGVDENNVDDLSTTTSIIVAAPPPPKVDYRSVLCGLAAGVISAGVFNPFDRALYLSVTNRTPFLTKQNFQNPYLGFMQSVGHRALSGGLYFPLEQFFMTVLVPAQQSTVIEKKLKRQSHNSTGALLNFLAGTAAGAMNAILINPISAIKYKSWGRETNRGMMTEAVEMLRKGGLRPFYNGLIPTLWRDLVFGGCYTFLRFEFQYRFQLSTDHQYISNFMAAAVATVASGPFNLARNEQYATKSRHVADTLRVVLSNFVIETREHSTLYEKCIFIQQRLRLGWGTIRVALGMSFANFLYDTLHGMVVK